MRGGFFSYTNPKRKTEELNDFSLVGFNFLNK